MAQEIRVDNMADPNRNLVLREDATIQARYTVPLPAPFSSERITVGLKTNDLEEARARRDIVERALEIAYYKVRRGTQ